MDPEGPQTPGPVAVVSGKLRPHRLPVAAVPRPALVERLAGGAEATLTLVSAPAGYGKTTLLTQWVQTAAAAEPDTAIAWVSLDPGDADPVPFWTTVITACDRAALGVGERALEVMRRLRTRQVEVALPLFLEGLAALPGRLLLVLDDFHHVETPEIDEAVEQLLAYRPPRVQVAIATRSDPSLRIPRLRAAGQLVEVRADRLAFTDDEARRFLAGLGVDDLSGDRERRLLSRVAGWPAPLRIAALMPAHQRDDFLTPLTGGHRELVDYITTDVLDVLPGDLRDFLLQVSVLDRMCGPLCDAVTAGTGSGARLAELERAGLFVSAEAGGEWYRSHLLFREALRIELERTDASTVPELHTRASDWFEQAGDLVAATEHAIAARDIPRIGRLLASQAQPMAALGQRDMFRRWVARLDWPEAQRDPEIGYARAMDAALHCELPQVEQWLDIAATGPAEQKDANGIPLGFRTDYIRAITAVHDVPRAEAAGRRAVETAPSPAFEGMAWCGVGQSLYLQDRFDEARECLTRAVSLVPDENPILLALARANLVLVEVAQHRTAPPAWMLQGAAALLQRAGAVSTPASAVLEMAEAEIHRIQGRLGEAVVYLESSLEILGPGRHSGLHANAYLLLSRVQADAGDPAAAARSLDAADGILSRARAPGALPARSRALRARLAAPVRTPSLFGQELTSRETEVLRLLAEGWSQREIAGRLFVSPNTVKTHVQSCYRKLGVTSRAGAVAALAPGAALATVAGAAVPPQPAGSHPGEMPGG